MHLFELDACSFSREGLKGKIKSPIIWGHKGCTIFPLCYLEKPSFLTESEWQEFLDGFTFQLTKKEAQQVIQPDNAQ